MLARCGVYLIEHDEPALLARRWWSLFQRKFGPRQVIEGASFHVLVDEAIQIDWLDGAEPEIDELQVKLIGQQPAQGRLTDTRVSPQCGDEVGLEEANAEIKCFIEIHGDTRELWKEM